MRSLKIVSLLGGVAMFLSACSQSPMDKLKSDIYYPDLNGAFWSKQKDQKTDLWKEATAYCDKHNEKINCGTLFNFQVMDATINSTKDIPAYGSSGHPLEVPDFSSPTPKERRLHHK